MQSFLNIFLLSRPLLGLFLEGVEEQTARLAAGVEAAVHAHSVQLLAAAAVDLDHLEARRDVPDVNEGNVAELAAPLHGDADAVEEGEDHVGEVFTAVEAFVGQAPHAVHRVGTLGLGEDILERDLDVIVDTVGIAVDKVNFSSCRIRHLEVWGWFLEFWKKVC